MLAHGFIQGNLGVLILTLNQGCKHMLLLFLAVPDLQP